VAQLTVITIDTVFHWGFSIRSVGSSAASLQYLAPSPQTIVGAFAWSLTRFLGIPEVVNGYSSTRLLIDKNIVLWATARLEGSIAPNSDMIRLLRAPYMREEYRASRDRQFGVSAFGRIYSPMLRTVLALVIDMDALKSFVYGYGFNGDVIEMLKAVASSIIRVGSKESIVSVDNVAIHRATNIRINPIETSFYTPITCIENNVLDVNAIQTSVPRYSEKHYELRGEVEIGREIPILIPSPEPWSRLAMVFGGKIRVNVDYNKCAVITIDNDSIIYPRDGIRGLG